MPFLEWLRHGEDLTDRVEKALALARQGNPEAGSEQVSTDFPRALEVLRAFREPADTSRLQLEAAWLYRSGEMPAARRVAEEALHWSDDPWMWNLLGRILVWIADVSEARPAFEKSSRLAPDRFVVPYRVTQDAFDTMAEDALGGIPNRYQLELSNIMVVTDDLPSIEMVQEGQDPDLLGIYEGATAVEHALPERIVLYQRNHENVSGDEAGLARLVEETMRHEVGHHFGMEEDELPY